MMTDTVTTSPANETSPKVYAIIVTYNGAQWIRPCLDSVQNSHFPCRAIVIDNASTDNTRSIIKAEFPETLLIAHGENAGFGVANNMGIAHALRLKADYCFLLNQDAYLLPDTLDLLLDALSKNTAFELATPLHCSTDQRQLDPTTQIAYLQRFGQNYVSDACLGQTQAVYPIRGINAAAWLVSSRALNMVGGFDPLFFMYGEDDDLINRFAYHGLAFALVPDARVIHVRGKGPKATLGWFATARRRSTRLRSDLIVAAKAPDTGRAVTRLLLVLTHGVLRPLIDFLVTRDTQSLLAYWLATGATLKDFPRILRHARQCTTAGPHFLDQEPSSASSRHLLRTELRPTVTSDRRHP